jgi:hypothetical protein
MHLTFDKLKVQLFNPSIHQQGIFMKAQKVTLVVKSDIKAGPPIIIKREN